MTGTTDGNRYSRDLRAKDKGLDLRWAEITRTLPFKFGRSTQNTTFTNIEGIFRIMQSVPSAKAEPFKKWLAKVGFERLEEIRNPELAIKRAITIYRAKGYDDAWIDARIRNKSSRETIIAEWDRRGMRDFIALLTDAIAVNTFGITTRSHKEFKGLKNQSLRDNMTPIELTLSTLGEQATTEIIKTTNPVSLQQHQNTARQGGNIAGQARRDIERATGKKVVSSQNYLTERQRANNAKNNPDELNNILDKLLNVPVEITDIVNAARQANEIGK